MAKRKGLAQCQCLQQHRRPDDQGALSVTCSRAQCLQKESHLIIVLGLSQSLQEDEEFVRDEDN